MSNILVLSLILVIDTLLLIFQISELSISYDETTLLNGSFSSLQLLIKASFEIFGKNDFALRFPMIFMHIMSVILLYSITKEYVKLERSRIWLILVFILLPGVMSSAIVVNKAGFILFGLLLFVYVYKRFSQRFYYPLLIFYMTIEGNFVYLFMALSLFSLYTKNRNFFLLNTVLTASSLFLYGIDIHGSPRGFFLDSIGLYAAIFTPIIFVYLFYVLYRKLLTKDIDILWFIAAITLVLSLLLSFRQKIAIEYFAPYIVLSLPLVAQTFEHSYRVRLNQFRKNYKTIFIISLVFLVINSSVVFFNKYLYLVVQQPRKHFTYKMHVAKELAAELKNRGIECVETGKKMAPRLEFM
ncbi:MAG: glycosyltransferase family 39 protein, partial [Sulfurimonas sp.]|nr:glycosyltransferase family 39 protein [Sulfurimonas sp.]